MYYISITKIKYIKFYFIVDSQKQELHFFQDLHKKAFLMMNLKYKNNFRMLKKL